MPFNGEQFGELKVFAGNSCKEFAQKVADYLGVALGELSAERFSNGEINIKIRENVRGRDVFLIQTLCEPVNEHLVELLVELDAFKRASSSRITAVIPHFAYARQDRKSEPHTPISAKLVANLLSVAGAGRVLTMDLHADQIQGFFDVPLDNLTASILFSELFKKKGLEDFVAVSPDAGGVKEVKAFADLLGLPIAVIHKHRPAGAKNFSSVEKIIGDVSGKNVVMVDDMIDTAGTVCNAADALKKEGAKEIFVCATHAILSGPAVERIKNSQITKLFLADTIPLPVHKKLPNIEVASVANLFGEAVRRSHNCESISELFEKPKTRQITQY